MATTTVRISKKASDVLREIAVQTGETMGAVLEKAVEAFQRQRFFDDLDAAYSALRSNPEAWAAEERERAEWDAVLMDGLTPEDVPDAGAGEHQDG